MYATHLAVYKIVNTITGDYYIGSSTRLSRRFWEHRTQLRKGTHSNKRLQASWNKYGEAAFSFEIFSEAPPGTDPRAIESALLLTHYGRRDCMNATNSVLYPSTADEVRAKTSAKLKERYAKNPELHPRRGKKHSEETKALISASRKGKGAGEDHYRYGQALDEETRKKIGDAQRGKPKGPRVYTQEGLARLKANAKRGADHPMYGKPRSEEDKQKMRKRLQAVDPQGNVTIYESQLDIRTALDISPTPLYHALKSGQPVPKGRFKGWTFSYASATTEAVSGDNPLPNTCAPDGAHA